MLRSKLILLKWKIKAHAQVEAVWKSKPVGYISILAFACLFVYWRHYIPSPGEAVAALAVGAVVMGFRGELSGLEKFLWILVIFAFLRLEIRAINTEHATYLSDQASARQALDEGFGAVLKDERVRFQKMLDDNQEKFRATVHKLEVVQKSENESHEKLDAIFAQNDEGKNRRHDAERQIQGSLNEGKRVLFLCRAVGPPASGGVNPSHCIDDAQAWIARVKGFIRGSFGDAYELRINATPRREIKLNPSLDPSTASAVDFCIYKVGAMSRNLEQLLHELTERDN